MTSKHKNIALLIGFFFILLISYHFAIKKTVEASVKHSELLNEIKVLKNSENRISYLKQHNSYLDSILKLNEVQVNVSFQQAILNKVSKYTEENKLKIISFSSPHVFKKDKKELITYALEIKGDFKALLTFVNFFENQRLGNIVSVSFLKKKNYRQNKNYLTVKIHLQKSVKN